MNHLRRYLAGALTLVMVGACAWPMPLLPVTGGQHRGTADTMDLGHPGGGTIRVGAVPAGPSGMRIQAAAVDPSQIDHYVYTLIRVPDTTVMMSSDAAATALYDVSDLVSDTAGNVIMADTGNHRVRMYCQQDGTYFGTPMVAGRVYTIAGSDAPAVPIQGEGVGGTNAALNRPSGLALDALGNLYIADTDHHRVRLLCKTPGNYFGIQAQAGHIYTIAGAGGMAGVSGTANGNGGPAQMARLQRPIGLAFDPDGNLYIADTGNNQIRTVARADGSAYLGINHGNAVQASKIYAVAGTGAVAPLANDAAGDQGLAIAARLNAPTYLAINADGDLYIADTGHHRIRFVDRTSHQMRPFAGSPANLPGPAGDGATATRTLRAPTKIAFWRSPLNAEHLLIADSGNHGVRIASMVAGDPFAGMVTGAGEIRHVAGSPTGEFGAADPLLNHPIGLTVSPDGTSFYIADSRNHRLRRLLVADGTSATVVGASHGSGVDIVTSPDTKSTAYTFTGVPPGTYALKVDAHNANHGSLVQGGPRTSTATITLPAMGSVDLQSANLLVELPLLDGTGGTVTVTVGASGVGDPTTGNLGSSLVRSGRIVTSYAPSGNPFHYYGLANDTYTVWTFAYDGANATPARPTASFVSSGGIVANNPPALDIPALLSTFGPEANAHLGDGALAAAAELNAPRDVVHHPDGLIIADTASDRVRMLCTADGVHFGVNMTAGNLYTIAGGGNAGAPGHGDGGNGISAALSRPQGLVLDPTGHLLIADTGHGRIRMLAANGGIDSLVVGALSAPTALALDDERNLYIADPGMKQVVLYAQQGNAQPRFDRGASFIPGETHRFGTGESVLTASGATNGDGAAASAARTEATGLAISQQGHVVLAEPKLNRLRVIANGDDPDYFGRDLKAGNIYHLAGDGASHQAGMINGALDSMRFQLPERVACDPADGTLLVTDSGNNAVRILAAEAGSRFGTVLAKHQGATITGASGLSHPGGLAVDPGADPLSTADDTLYVADVYHGQLKAISSAGSVSTVAGNGWTFSLPLGDTNDVAVDTAGNVYIADAGYHVVRMICRQAGTYYGRMMEAGKSYRIAGVPGVAGHANGALGLSLLHTPSGLALHDGHVYVADTGNHRLRVLARSATTFAGGANGIAVAAGALRTLAGNGLATSVDDDNVNSLLGTLSGPTDVAVDSRGNVVIAETGGRKIRVLVNQPWSSDLVYGRSAQRHQLITVVNASGAAGSTGDGDVAIAATLTSPGSIALDSADWLYILDRATGTVRIVPAEAGILYGNLMRAGRIYASPLAAAGAPRAIAVDPGGNVYVADTGTDRVRMLARSNGATYVVAGGGAGGDHGLAVNGQVTAPTAVVIGTAGRLSILSNGRVREVY